MLSALFDVSVWECVNAVTKGLFLTLDHPLANDYDCFATSFCLSWQGAAPMSAQFQRWYLPTSCLAFHTQTSFDLYGKGQELHEIV